jgi:hypothetical protein
MLFSYKSIFSYGTTSHYGKLNGEVEMHISNVVQMNTGILDEKPALVHDISIDSLIVRYNNIFADFESVAQC